MSTNKLYHLPTTFHTNILPNTRLLQDAELVGTPPHHQHQAHTKIEVKINNAQTALLGRSKDMTSRKQF